MLCVDVGTKTAGFHDGVSLFLMKDLKIFRIVELRF